MRKIILPLFFLSCVFAGEKSGTLTTQECNKIFEQRKYELQLQLERIEERTQALEALNSAQKQQQTQREQLLKTKIDEANARIAEIKQREQNTKAMLDENKKVLDDIQKAKDNKIRETTLKMKPGQGAAILSEMNVTQSASILFAMEPKKMAELLGKMDPKKAADVINRINQGPPF